jgi:hypothetical protein
MRTLCCAAALLICFGGLSEARAQNILANPTFEFCTGTDGQGQVHPGQTNLTGWSIAGGPVQWITGGPHYNGLSGQDGGNGWVDLTGANDYSKATISQSVTLNPGDIYEISVWLCQSSWYNRGNPASIRVKVDGFDQTYVYSIPQFGYGDSRFPDQWQNFTATFTAASSSAVFSVEGISADQYIGVDNLSLINKSAPSNPVPEPGPAALAAGSGMMFLAAAIRRRRA